MAGLRGNNAWWMIQKQTVQGTAATASPVTTIKHPFTAGSIAPTREIGNLAETDVTRDQGVAYTKTSGVKGNPECYVRDVSMVPLLYGVLGADAITANEFEGEILSGKLSEIAGVTSFTNVYVGAELSDIATGKAIEPGSVVESFNEGTKIIVMSKAANKIIAKEKIQVGATHTIVPQNAQTYFTLWSMLGETLYEQHKDCFISDLEIKATAGSPLTAQATIVGRETTRLTSDPGVTVPMQKGTVYSFNNGNIEIGGGATALVSSMTLNIQNNVTPQQTDAIIPIDIASGKRAISCSFDMIFENLNEYNKFNYGSTSGTVVSNVIYTAPIKFKYELDANHSIEFSIPKFAYEEFPVAPEVQGAPIVVAVKGVAQREPNIITAVVKTGQRSY